MPDPATDAAANVASRRRKMLIAGNLIAWLFGGAYTISPIDLIPDVVPLLGWADDLIGMILVIGFTIYTIRTLRTQGLGALVPGMAGTAGSRTAQTEGLLTTSKTADNTPTIVDVKVEGLKDYEPIAPDKIKSL